MTSITDSLRLFDCIEYQLHNSPIEDMFAAKENGEWVKYSTEKVASNINNLSAGLLELGINCGDMLPENRDKIAVISKNRPEWLILDMAVQRIGAVLTPIYPTINIDELEFILNDARVKMVFVNDEDLYKKVDLIRHKIPTLTHIFSFELMEEVNHWKEILNLSSPERLSEAAITADKIGFEDLATIIYTSGTTGIPKGVMLSHKNILSNVKSSIPCFPPGQNLKALSFLPLNHIFERMVSYIYLFKGTSIYYAESFETIGENLKEVKPNLFTTVPRVLEKIYDKIMAKGRELTGAKKKLFYWAHDLAENFDIQNKGTLVYRMQLALANKLVFKKWRAALGNELLCIVAGGAACQVRLIKIFTAAQIPIMEGYGLTETSPVISVNRFQEKGRMFGTVGPLINGVTVEIAEDGEILCKGPNIMMGYYKQPELTAEVFENGWFKTGDIGMLVNNVFLKITDRKKELFKTSGGKYVAPLPIENKLKESRFIENVMVLGAERKYTSALIVPSYPNLIEWCRKQSIADTGNEELIKNEKVLDMYKDLIESFNKYFNHVEQVKKFKLLPQDWSVDSGELTPKQSLKRRIILEKNQHLVDEMYN
ncbi:MAG: long-chain fatty acid--CoA ligase [Ginsengibacter sp.]